MDVIYAYPENYPVYWYLRDFKKVKYLKTPINGIAGWNGSVWQGKAEMNWANDQVLNGKRSIKIYSKDGADSSWYQKVRGNGGEAYVLSGWMKTKNIVNINATRYAKVMIRGASDSLKILGESKTLTGSKNWTYFRIPFTLPEDEEYIRINLALAAWGYAKGTVWFDNLSLTGATLKNPDFEEGLGTDKYPSVYIISVKDEHTVGPEFSSKYVKERYELRPKIMVAAYFRKDLL